MTDVFISHASEDKDSFVRPLAQKLRSERYDVWYDEFSLTLGDSLRRSIDKGLANSRYGIVVISHNFLRKEWPQRELDGLTAREIDGRKVILPIWHGVERSDVLRYSPTLADRLAVKTFKGMHVVVDEIIRVLGQPSPDTTPSRYVPSDGDDLSSERNVDYTQLRDLLAAGNWKDADYETYLVMLKVVGREKGDWISYEEILNFPCTDLRTIDSLWVKYSNGRFGFSVQKKIYLEVGGIPDAKFYEEAWKKFGARVGWRKGLMGYWIVLAEDLTFSVTSAPMGHLPSGGTSSVYRRPTTKGLIWFVDALQCRHDRTRGQALGPLDRLIVLFYRIQTCKL